MSGRIPRKVAGHGDPKFCSCSACKALREGKAIAALPKPGPLSSGENGPKPGPLSSGENGPFPAAHLSGTLEFSARGFSGYYNLAGEWISTSSHRFTGKV